MNEAAFKVLGVIDCADGPVSSEQIARSLGITRSTVARHIHELRTLGYDISSQKTGYRIMKRSEKLLPYEVCRDLQTQVLGRTIKFFERTASTTWVAKQLLSETDPAELHGTVIIAEEQTGGVGRLGRAWVSPPGGIWTTIILKPAIPVDHVFMVTMAASIAVVRAIRKECDLGALIKWPNDILIGSKKVAGILLELSAEGASVNYCILGMGIDANLPLADLSPALRQQVTSLAAEMGRPVDRAPFLAAVLKELERHLSLQEEREYETVVREWKSLSGTLEHRVRIHTMNRTFEGDAVDIDEYGALIVRKDTGAVERVIAGDCTHI